MPETHPRRSESANLVWGLDSEFLGIDRGQAAVYFDPLLTGYVI